ncbi:DUF2971 domain-containing protein [Streptomyces shenzhenensis]|uniref:DUF2971 domain-containing protein n=1 Tax=Streptomyces shenzhenensis TaxID=943815 RepID=UPI0036C5629F
MPAWDRPSLLVPGRGILASGKLRLSPYQFTNDLWESQPHYPSFSIRSGAGSGPDLALWAHFGDGHQGVCLKFDRDPLIEAFLHHQGPASLAFHGPVRYLSSPHSPAIVGIDLEQVDEFGIDAVSLAYAEANKEQLFFRKHIDPGHRRGADPVLQPRSVRHSLPRRL